MANDRLPLEGENWITTTFNGKKEVMKVDSARFPCWGHYPPYDGHEVEFHRRHISTGVDFELEDYNDIMWVCFWHQGTYNDLPWRRTWKERLSDIWKLLRNKPIHYEEFLFDKRTVEAMGEYLSKKGKEMTQVNPHIYHGDPGDVPD